MIKLTGSEKQIAWATQIIDGAYKVLDSKAKDNENFIAKLGPINYRIMTESLTPEAIAELRKMLDNNFTGELKASMVIDIRSSLTERALTSLGRDYMRANGQI